MMKKSMMLLKINQRKKRHKPPIQKVRPRNTGVNFEY